MLLPVKSLIETVLSPFFRCTVCSRTPCPQGLCSSCTSLLPWRAPACSQCGKTFEDGFLCDCHGRRNAFDHLTSVFEYEAPVSVWIMRLKFHNDWAKARVIGSLLSEFEWGGRVVLPIPLHYLRRGKRGFNQVHECLRYTTVAQNALYRPRWVKRIRHTKAQSELHRGQRLKNLKGAFWVSPHIKGRHVLIVDDVYTTGATVNAMALACRAAGALKVDVLTFAIGKV